MGNLDSQPAPVVMNDYLLPWSSSGEGDLLVNVRMRPFITTNPHDFALYQLCGAIGSSLICAGLIVFFENRILTSRRPLHNASIKMLASSHISSRPLR
jgi:hypothetical protein